MKYSKNFERDWNWYYKYKDEFTFDGSDSTGDRVIHDINGRSAKDAFLAYDQNGKVVPTREPDLLFKIYKCKGSINLHIKMWAEDRAEGILPKVLFDSEIVVEFELLDWMVKAVENQKIRIWKQNPEKYMWLQKFI